MTYDKEAKVSKSFLLALPNGWSNENGLKLSNMGECKPSLICTIVEQGTASYQDTAVFYEDKTSSWNNERTFVWLFLGMETTSPSLSSSKR
jgi:hypothetical protein